MPLATIQATIIYVAPNVENCRELPTFAHKSGTMHSSRYFSTKLTNNETFLVDTRKAFSTWINMFFMAAVLVWITIISGCDNEKNSVPRPHAFPKVEYPSRLNMVDFDKNFCNFTFKLPDYVVFKQDTAYFDEKPKDPCWFNLEYPMFNARLHCSYYPINGANKFDKLISDVHELAGKHNIKADYIDELIIQKPNHVSGKAFDIQGSAASPFQFYLTDSTHHFFRGSLYFYTKTRPDSLAPIFNFVKTDITEMINTFEWNQ